MGSEAEAERRSCVAAFGFKFGLSTSTLGTGSFTDVEAARNMKGERRGCSVDDLKKHV